MSSFAARFLGLFECFLLIVQCFRKSLVFFEGFPGIFKKAKEKKDREETLRVNILAGLPQH